MLQSKNLLRVWQYLVVMHSLVSSLIAAFEFQGLGWSGACANIRVIGDSNLDRYALNPALMNSNLETQLIFQFGQAFSGLDLNTMSLKLAHQIRHIPTTLNIEVFGDDLYSEQAIDLGCAWSLDTSLRIGLNLGYYQLAIPEWQSALALTLSPGLFFELTDDIHFGSVLQHVIQMGNSLELPQRFLFGAEYQTDPIILMLSIEKEAALPMEFCGGLISTPKRGWQLACGYRDGSHSFSAGWRIRLDRYAAAYTWSGHPDLPASHGLTVEVFFR